MEERKVAIRLSGIKKRYRLGQIGGGTLQGDLQSWWARIRGKEDPNLPLWQDQRLVGQTFMALNGIDLTVYKGETLGIIGGNGAGKSTMLKLLSRVTAPTEGEIDIYGRISSMLEVGTGFNGQMTGRENIYMNGTILGMKKSEIDEKMEDIIEFSEVREFIDTPVKRYSSGMFVKLAFSVAAHLNNEIMIMDEVLAVGDVAFQKKCLAKMKEAATLEGRTILYVSHNMNTIRELCDRCIVMDKGEIIFDGDVEEAIGIYMDLSVEDNEVDMDLRKKNHVKQKTESPLRMEHLTLVDKLTPMYDREEKLKLHFLLDVKEAVRDVKFRLTFRNDMDHAITTAWSKPMNFGKTGQTEVAYEMPLKLFRRGTLYASIGFYRTDEYGRLIQLDHITRAFKIQIQAGEQSEYWSVRAYGYMELEELECTLNQ